jgi:hypothetical protein
MKCNKEELHPSGAAPRGPRKNQRPGETHRPHPPGRPEPASQEPHKQQTKPNKDSGVGIILIELKKLGWDDKDWIYLSQDMGQWRVVVKAVMTLRLS